MNAFRTFAALMVLALAAAPSSARAGDADVTLSGASRAHVFAPSAAASPALTEAEAIARALTASSRLTALRQAAAAQERRSGLLSSTWNNPELRINDLELTRPDRDAQQIGVGIRWQPPRLGEWGFRRQNDRVRLWERKAEEEEFRLELISDVRKAFVEVALYREAAALSERSREVREEHESCLERLLALGQCSLLDRVRAGRRLVEARRDEALSRERLRSAETRLAGFLGGTFGSEATPGSGSTALPVLAPPETPDDSLSLAEACALARKTRADVALAVERRKLLGSRHRYEGLQRIPWPTFLQVTRHLRDEKEDWSELLLGVDLPLFQLDPREIRSSSGDPGAGEAVTAAGGESVDADVARELGRYHEARAAWQSLRNEAERLRPGLARLIDEEKRLGTALAGEAYELELTQIELALTLLDARLELARAGIDLCRAVGVEGWPALRACRAEP